MTSFAKLLAQAVEKHPVLYSQAAQTDAKKEDYDDAWQAVAVECEKPVAIIKSRWSKTVKALMQHLANPPPKNSRGRKTRSSEFPLLDELKWLLPYVNDEATPQPWEEVSMNESDLLDLKSNSSMATTEASPTPPASSATATAKKTTPKSKINQTKTKKPERDSSTDSCNEMEILANLAAKKKNNAKVIGPQMVLNDKRKREQSKAYMNDSTKMVVEKKKTESGDFFVSEPILDRSSSIRFRRIVEDPTRKDKTTTESEKEKEKEQPVKFAALNKLLRRRSSSIFMEREASFDSNADDDDILCQPPPTKKLAVAVSNKLPEANRVRCKARVYPVGIKKTINAATRSPTTSTSTPVNAASSASKSVSKTTRDVCTKSQTNALDNTPTENFELGSGIDLSIIEAAAAAEREAALEQSMTAHCFKDIATQCEYEADEEDNEFVERTRLWLQRMNPRQKLVFRKGVYQAFLDVYDDPRNFETPKGIDKYMMTQLNGMPALFTGMSPIELRLVRQLAIAVAGNKLNSSNAVVPKYLNQELNCKSPSLVQTNTNTTIRTTQQQSSPPQSLASMRAPTSEKPPSVLRTTAIALSNQTRTPTGMQRVLRKVVRVDNSAAKNEGNTQNNNAGGSGGGSNSSNNINLARARTVSVNSSNGSNPQRIYRILPNGNIMRHSTVSSGSGNNNSASSSSMGTITQTSSAATTPPSNSTNRAPSQAQQQQSQSTTSTLTTSTGTVITTRNIKPKPTQPSANNTTQMLVDPKTGYIIRRQHLNVSNAGNNSSAGTTTPEAATKTAVRPPMSRRYSICSIPRELKQHQTAAEQADTLRWSSTLPKTQATGALNSSSSSALAPPKPIVRVRYAQGQNAAAAANAARSNNNGGGGATSDNEFALPALVSPRKSANSQRDSPVPVLISSSGENSDAILKRAQKVYENTFPKAEACTIDNNGTAEHSSKAGKTDCLITSDMIDDFVVKNEPFDQDDEDMLNDLMADS